MPTVWNVPIRSAPAEPSRSASRSASAARRPLRIRCAWRAPARRLPWSPRARGPCAAPAAASDDPLERGDLLAQRGLGVAELGRGAGEPPSRTIASSAARWRNSTPSNPSARFIALAKNCSGRNERKTYRREPPHEAPTSTLLVYALVFCTELGQSMLFPLLPVLADEFALSDAQTGAILAASTLATVAAAVPPASSPPAAARASSASSRRRVALSAAIQALAPTFAVLLLARCSSAPPSPASGPRG